MNWPNYARPTESDEDIEHIKNTYMALVAFCDEQLGRLLDKMDEENLWEDTAIIMTTDHGFLLSEHDWWAKAIMPNYQEISHIPLMIYHPEYQNMAGQKRSYTTSTIDIMPTVLDWHGCSIPEEVQGQSLTAIMKEDSSKDRVVSCEIFGGSALITDGRYAYHYFPTHLKSEGLYEYRLHPCHMRGQFSVKEMQNTELHQGFDFTKGMPLMKIKSRDDSKRVPNHNLLGFQDNGTRLFDLLNDPNESNPIRNPQVEERLLSRFQSIMEKHDAPKEMYERFGLEK